MAGEDYAIKTKVEADVSDFEKGMNKAEKSLKGFSQNIANSIDRLGKKGLIGSIANVTLAMQGVTKSFSTITKVVKDVGRVIGECTDAYKNQAIAEKALDKAIENNPLMNGQSSKNLKGYATELQKVTNYGDEQLIPMMTNLVSLGRSESDTMKIMSVAVDMAAGTGQSLDSVISQLNSTLNGNIGRLGQQNAELKTLSEEELKSGKALDILGEKFKGLAGATADTSKQLKNIKGDFKESIGKLTTPSKETWNKFWISFYDKGIKTINAINDKLDTVTIGTRVADDLYLKAKEVADGIGSDVESVLNDIGFLDNELKNLTSNELQSLQNYIGGMKKKTGYQQTFLKLVGHELQNRQYEQEIEAKRTEEEKKRAELLAGLVDKEKSISTLKQEHLDKIKAQEENWKNIELVTGQTVSNEEKLKFYQDDLVSILDEAKGEITEQNDYYIQQKKIIEELIKAIGEKGEEVTVDLSALELKILKQRQSGLKQWSKEYHNVTLKIIDYERTLAIGNAKTQEERLKLQEYYDLEIEKENKRHIEALNQQSKERIQAAKDEAENVASTVIAVMKTIGNVISKAISSFKKLIEIDTDTMLDNLLEVEDKILTFVVETLPKLPSTISRIITSIMKLFASLDWSEIARGFVYTVKEIITAISENIDSFSEAIFEIVDGIIEIAMALLEDDEFIGKLFGSLTNLLMKIVIRIIQILPQLITNIATGLIKALTAIITTISDWLPGLIKAIVESVPQFISAVFTIAMEIINALPQIIDSISQALPKIIPALVESFIKVFISLITNPMRLIELASGIAMALVQACASVASMLVEAVSTLVASFIALFTGDEQWNNSDNLFAQIWDGIKTSFTNMINGVKEAWENLINWFKNKKDALKNAISGAFSGITDKIKSAWGKLTGGYATGTNNATSGIHLVGEAGPELVRFRGGEQVLNAQNTQKALENIGGSTNNFNVVFNNLQDTSAYTMIQQLRQYNRNLAINGIL